MLFTLPPDQNSGGRPHGHFELALSAPVWTSIVSKPSHAHVRFWGHCRSHEQVIAMPQEHKKAFSAVPITVGAHLICMCTVYSVALRAQEPKVMIQCLQDLQSSCPT